MSSCSWSPLRLGADKFLADFLVLLNTDRSLQMRDYYEDPSQRSLMTGYAVELLGNARNGSAVDYARASRRRLDVAEHLRDLMQNCDVLATPTVGIVAPHRDNGTVTTPAIVFTFMANFAGYPAVSIPCGLVDGMPVALQLLTHPDREHDLFALAAAYERSVGWPKPPSL